MLPHHDMVFVAGDVSVGALERAAKHTCLSRRSGRGGPIDGDPDEATVIECFVSLRLS